MMVEDLLLDETLTEEELIEKYGPIPEDIPVAPIKQTLKEAVKNEINTELEVDADETSNEDLQA